VRLYWKGELAAINKWRLDPTVAPGECDGDAPKDDGGVVDKLDGDFNGRGVVRFGVISIGFEEFVEMGEGFGGEATIAGDTGVVGVEGVGVGFVGVVEVIGVTILGAGPVGAVVEGAPNLSNRFRRNSSADMAGAALGGASVAAGVD